MTKPFRVKEEIQELTRALRERNAGPESLYRFLEEKGIDIDRSVLISHIPEQGPCIVGRIIDQNNRLISYDIEFEGSWNENYSFWRKIIVVNEWKTQTTEGDWWWKESPKLTRPKPNNPIYIALNLLKDEAQQAGSQGFGS
jgi:hypothetical protein